MSNIGYRLVGYDRTTQRVAGECYIPDNLMGWAKKLAHVPADDPEAAMCYPLDNTEARDLAGAVGGFADIAKNEYFLEGFAISDPGAPERVETQNGGVFVRGSYEECSSSLRGVDRRNRKREAISRA